MDNVRETVRKLVEMKRPFTEQDVARCLAFVGDVGVTFDEWEDVANRVRGLYFSGDTVFRGWRKAGSSFYME